MLSDGLENKLGDVIDRSVNDSFNSTKFDGDIDSQNRMAEKIHNDVIKHKEYIENIKRLLIENVKNFSFEFIGQ